MEEHLQKALRFLTEGRYFRAGAEVADLHPADIAALMETLDSDDKRELFKVLPARVAADVVVELSDYSTDKVLEGIRPQHLADIVDDMPSDEATDLIADLPDDKAQEVLKRIDLEDSSEVRTLLQYEEDTAGGIMQLELVSAQASQTVDQVIESIRERREEVGELHNVFVVDNHNVLMGLLPLSSMLLAQPDTLVASIMQECPLTVIADEDQESVAHQFRRYDVVSAPVVDEAGRLLGRITSDDVMQVLEEEASEDIARMAGYSADDEVFYSRNVFKISRLRMPWLLTNMAGGLLTGALLWLFKVQLADALFLLAFIPVIMAMAGNVGVQSSTLMVRGFALGEVDFKNIYRILYKEIRVALVLGLACGVGVGIVANFWHHNPVLGLVVGVSMASAITTAAMLGTLIPTLFRWLNVDPAISSGPVVTTVNDILGILIYFGIATLFYRYLVV